MFEFQARPVHTVLGGILLYPRNAAFDVLRNFRDYIESAPDELTTYAALLQPLPLPAMQSLLASSFPDGNHNYWKSTLQRALPDDAIKTIVEQANHMSSPFSFVVLENYGRRGQPRFEGRYRVPTPR